MQPAKDGTRSREQGPEDHPDDKECVQKEHSGRKSRIEVWGRMHDSNLLQRSENRITA